MDNNTERIINNIDNKIDEISKQIKLTDGEDAKSGKQVFVNTYEEETRRKGAKRIFDEKLNEFDNLVKEMKDIRLSQSKMDEATLEDLKNKNADYALKEILIYDLKEQIRFMDEQVNTAQRFIDGLRQNKDDYEDLIYKLEVSKESTDFYYDLIKSDHSFVLYKLNNTIDELEKKLTYYHKIKNDVQNMTEEEFQNANSFEIAARNFKDEKLEVE